MYDYDSSGTLRSTVTYSSTDYYNKYGGQYYYDDESRISEIQESFDYSVGSGYSQGGNSYLFRYTNEGSLDKFSIIDYNYSAVIKPQYDRFRKPNYPESVYDYYYYDKNLQGDNGCDFWHRVIGAAVGAVDENDFC